MDETYTSSIEPERPPVDIEATRGSMSVDNAGGHTWESFLHDIQIGSVANASVHHLVVTFRPRNTVIVASACTDQNKEQGCRRGEDI